MTRQAVLHTGTLVTAFLLLRITAETARAQGLQSNHGVLRAVPVRQAVTVAGRLDEWDCSAEIFSYGVRRLRDRYSVRVVKGGESAIWRRISGSATTWSPRSPAPVA